MSLTTKPVIELAVTRLQAQGKLIEGVFAAVSPLFTRMEGALRWVRELCVTGDATVVSSYSKPSGGHSASGPGSKHRPSSVPPLTTHGASSLFCPNAPKLTVPLLVHAGSSSQASASGDLAAGLAGDLAVRAVCLSFLCVSCMYCVR
jgi:hypothetical protein